MKLMKFHGTVFTLILFLFLISSSVPAEQVTIQEPVKMENNFQTAKEKAVTWLKNQVVPNDAVPEPAKLRKNFILSYNIKDRTGNRKYLHGKSTLYDNALAAIAFAMSGDMDSSEAILTSVLKNRTTDNNLWFSYNTHNEWPDQNDSEGAVIRTGASAWFGYAVVFYLEKIKESHIPAEKVSSYERLLRDSSLIADAVLKRQVKKRHDLRYGFVSGGDNQYRILYDDKTENPEEIFEKGRIEWISSEHNIDTYFFLKSLYDLTGNETYKTAYQDISGSLCNNWEERICQLIRGRSRTSVDFAESLDCASWGSMFLRSAGNPRKADKALQSCSGYISISEGKAGYKPYRNLPVYEDSFLNSIIFPDNPDKNWNDVPMLWHEGSLGVAMAYIKAGRFDQAKAIISNVISFQDTDGGVPYSSIPVQFQFSTESSVASTAWLVMAISAYENEEIRNIFWR